MAFCKSYFAKQVSKQRSARVVLCKFYEEKSQKMFAILHDYRASDTMQTRKPPCRRKQDERMCLMKPLQKGFPEGFLWGDEVIVGGQQKVSEGMRVCAGKNVKR